jgi:hypothetical protein
MQLKYNMKTKYTNDEAMEISDCVNNLINSIRESLATLNNVSDRLADVGLHDGQVMELIDECVHQTDLVKTIARLDFVFNGPKFKQA